MKQLIVFIYCLPMDVVAGLLLAATFVLLLLYRRFRCRRWLRPALLCAVLLWFAAVLYITLLNRSSAPSRTPSLIPFHTYWQVLNGGSRELLLASFMNVALFYPGGVLFRALSPGGAHPRGLMLTVLLSTCFSVCIEYCQYAFALGSPETDDVLHNTLGALAGWLCLHLLLKAADRS